MKSLLFSLSVLCLSFSAQSQQSAYNEPSRIFKLTQDDLAGENLTLKKGENPYYQGKVYDGKDLMIFSIAISNVTNTFESFPLEEFIFWKNGKARIDPEGEQSMIVQAGDYLIQPKGFKGRFNFIGGDEYHLEFSVITKQRAAKSKMSPINKAMVISRDIISGASPNHKGERVNLYSGVEIEVNLLRSAQINFESNTKERLIHVVNGIITMTPTGGKPIKCYPGDFFVIPEDFKGSWQSTGAQALRAFEVYKAG